MSQSRPLPPTTVRVRPCILKAGVTGIPGSRRKRCERLCPGTYSIHRPAVGAILQTFLFVRISVPSFTQPSTPSNPFDAGGEPKPRRQRFNSQAGPTHMRYGKRQRFKRDKVH